MKSFSLALVAGIASAYSGKATATREGYGTTGHYKNSYGHGGYDDHDHHDHIYGYDSIAQDLNLDSATQETARDNIIIEAENANDKRVAYLAKVKAKRIQRLNEIKAQNDAKITAPFDYQLRLLTEEEDDILQARNNAIRDANDAFDDLEWRLDDLADDIIESQEIEIEKIVGAMDRSVVDRKAALNVFFALKVEWLTSTIVVDAATPGNTAYTRQADTFDKYDTIFDDFHYDIGHGKGTGEGQVDDAPVTDGQWTERAGPSGPVGDYEQDVGQYAHAWEMPGSKAMRY